MEQKTDYSGTGIFLALMFVMFIVFTILKCTATIAWSWWWVASPLLITLGIFLISFLISLVYVIVEVRKNNKKYNPKK